MTVINLPVNQMACVSISETDDLLGLSHTTRVTENEIKIISAFFPLSGTVLYSTVWFSTGLTDHTCLSTANSNFTY